MERQLTARWGGGVKALVDASAKALTWNVLKLFKIVEYMTIIIKGNTLTYVKTN